MNALKTSLEYSHFPVMLKEVINICSPTSGGKYIDCTFGGGGYTKEILKFPNTKVIALDRDITTEAEAKKMKKKYPDRFFFYNERFSNLENILNNNTMPDSIIFDLGMSSFQLLDMSRGFSFKSTDTIDMQMGLSSQSAEEIINNYDENYLKLIIKILGEEKEASKIARNIVLARKVKKISKVSELVKIIERSKKKKL